MYNNCVSQETQEIFEHDEDYITFLQEEQKILRKQVPEKQGSRSGLRSVVKKMLS